MRKLWNEILDWTFPRYVIGVDPAAGPDFEVALLLERARDGKTYIHDRRFARYGRDLPFRWRFPMAARAIDWFVSIVFGAALVIAFFSLSGCGPIKRVNAWAVPECQTFAYPDAFGRLHVVECSK